MPGVGDKWFPDTPDGHREARAFGRANPDLPQREGTGAHVYHYVIEQENRHLDDPEFNKMASTPAFPPGTMKGFLDELHKIAVRVHDDDSATGWERASESPGQKVHQTDKSHDAAKKRVGHKGKRLASDLINTFNKTVVAPVTGAKNRAASMVDRGLKIGENANKNANKIRKDGVRVSMGI